MAFVLRFLESSSSTSSATTCLNDHDGNKHNAECHRLGKPSKHRSNVVPTYERRKRNKHKNSKRKQQYYTADCVIVAHKHSE